MPKSVSDEDDELELELALPPVAAASPSTGAAEAVAVATFALFASLTCFSKNFAVRFLISEKLMVFFPDFESTAWN